ncbi:MAG TPA: metallophosphoesterase [Candidatus Acidoferrales bacterium]|nr:metallophosphoesterase [Candidatus Acidoferrales bacterium]
MTKRAMLLAGCVAGALLAGCGHQANRQPDSAEAASSARAAAPAVPPSGDPVLIGAGDIADCADLSGAEATAKILEATPGTVFTAGDDAYPSGTKEQFANCYDKTWGRVKSRTRPSPGNHEFHSGGAAPYFDYFGASAGDPKTGYYSYDLGAWHIVVLNSECGQVGGCRAGSAEERWLHADLASHRAACTLAYWHKPLFSSGAKHGNDPEVKPLWQDLYNAKATIVVNGHDHDYERFAPQDPDGKADGARGIREFVVGTGGKNHRPFGRAEATSEVRNADTFGVLKLTLHATGYDWQFIPEAGKSFTDSGNGTCH